MTASTSLRQCQALAALLGAEKVSLPGSAAYHASLSSYFAIESSNVQPLCFVSPQTTSDVSVAIGFLASEHLCDFAIRSGGHTWFPGASNIQGGVTIDLRGLNSIKLSTDHSTVSTGPGATWDVVYAKLDPLQLTVAGGRVGGVGVGGLTLGGGISFLGPRAGWTCTTASAFEVVLADGSVVEANESENTDLFHGLRGGSNNFGVVTRIDLKTFDQGLVWAATLYNPLSVIDDQVKIFANLTVPENYDENASFITGFGYSAAQGVAIINNNLVYTKPVENPPYYKDFLSLPSLLTSSETISMTALAQQQAALLPPGASRYLYATTTIIPTEKMLRLAFDAWNASLVGVLDVSGLIWSLSLDPIPPSMYQRDANTNVLGLDNRTGSLVVCLLSQGWSDEADDERMYKASAALIAVIEDAARYLDAYDPFLYFPYAAFWQKPIESYGPTRVKQLHELRERIDPRGVFTHLVPGGFKLPP